MDEEQLSAIQFVVDCTEQYTRPNYYEILEVDQFSSEDEIKRAYRRKALLLHPDKNKHPGAERAFKALNNAMMVLGNAEKRLEYDTELVNSFLQESGYGPSYVPTPMHREADLEEVLDKVLPLVVFTVVGLWGWKRSWWTIPQYLDFLTLLWCFHIVMELDRRNY